MADLPEHTGELWALRVLSRASDLAQAERPERPPVALALADRIGVLGRGRLLQVDSPAEIVKKPRHRAVAMCLGWPAMNFAIQSVYIFGRERVEAPSDSV